MSLKLRKYLSFRQRRNHIKIAYQYEIPRKDKKRNLNVLTERLWGVRVILTFPTPFHNHTVNLHAKGASFFRQKRFLCRTGF